MKQLLSTLTKMPEQKQAKLFLMIAENNINHLRKEQEVFLKAKQVLKISWNYLNTNTIPIKMLDDLLSYQDGSTTFYITPIFDMDKKGAFNYPFEANILSLIIGVAAYLMQHYRSTADGQAAIDNLIKQEKLHQDENRLDFGGDYLGNVTLSDLLEAPRKGGLLDPEIFSQFGIDLNQYNLEEEASF